MKLLKKSLLLSTVVASSLYASGWEDILKGSNIDGVLLDDGAAHTVTLYNSTFTYTVNNNDGISGNFAGSDTATITLVSNGSTLTSGAVKTDDELKTWAESNANAIIKSVFGGDPASSLGGQNTAVASSVTLIQTLDTLTSTTTTKKDKKGLKLNNSFGSKTVMNSETASIKDGTKSIDSTNGIIAFSNEMDSGNSIGLITAYKYTKSNDTFSSKTASLSFAPFYKIENQIDENFDIPVILNLTGNLVYLESSIFPDGAGYLEYGVGAGIVPRYQIDDQLSIITNLSYQYLKKHIPSSYVPDDAKWIADAINNLKPLQTVSYGIGAEYKILSNWNVTANALQVKHLVTDDIQEGRDTATYYTVSSRYDWTKWSFGLGYKQVEDVRDYDETAYMASLSYKW